MVSAHTEGLRQQRQGLIHVEANMCAGADRHRQAQTDRSHLPGKTELHMQCGVYFKKKTKQGFPGGLRVENPPANAGVTGLSPGPGRSHKRQSN